MIITEKPYHYELDFPYHPRIILAIKRKFDPTQRRYDAKSKMWIVNKSQEVRLRAFAEKFKFQFITEEPEIIQDWSLLPSMPKLEVDPRDYVNADLYDYQKEGVARILRDKKVLCGDQMGLGKTIQTVTSLIIANAFPCLVIAPSSLKYNWQEEFMKWGNIKSIILNDSVKRTWPNFYKMMNIPVFITNYESLKKYFVAKMPAKARWKASDVEFNNSVKLLKSVVVDEAHRIKEGSTIQSKLTRGICSFAEYRILLSGTFVVNNPKDLIAPLAAVGKLKSVFGGYQAFTNRFCPGSKPQNLDELQFKLRSSCFFMRFKSDVLKNLPDKTRQIVHCDITNQAEYDKAENEFARYLKENLEKSQDQIDRSLRGEIMVKIGLLKQIAAKGKLRDALDWIKDVVDGGQKIVVFCWHKAIANAVHEKFKGSVMITGDVDIATRNENVKKFQTDPTCHLIVCTIKSGGVGITLTASSISSFIELGWSPKDMDQAEGRCHRIGAKDNVTCPYFLGRGTIDEHIYEIIDKKRTIVQAITGGKNDVETSVLDDIINLYKNK